jgi:hypothetical protein
VRRVPFSYFVRPDSFSTVPRATSSVFTFCASGLVFGGMEGVGSRFHILRSRTHFRRYGGCRVPFSYFALPGSFPAVPRALVPFSSFALPNSFSVVPRASGPVFKFCAPKLVFGGTEVVRSRCHILRDRTRFWRCRARLVPFSCFVCLNSFSAVSRATGPFFKFCAPRQVSDGTAGIGSRFQVLRSRTQFCGTKGIGSRFEVLRDMILFRRYRGRWPSFSCFELPNTFSTVPRASAPVFMFCTPELIFGGTAVIGSRFHF